MRALCKILTFLSTFSAMYPSDLYQQYVIHSTSRSDIYEHLPILRNLAQECSAVTEIGVRREMALRYNYFAPSK